MKKTPAKKKTPNNQHDIRGASFLRIAKRLRSNAKEYRTDVTGQESELGKLLDLLADAFEAESKTARYLR